MEETETITVTVKYYLEAEYSDSSGTQRSGPFGTRAAAETAATALLSRSNTRKVSLVREVQE